MSLGGIVVKQIGPGLVDSPVSNQLPGTHHCSQLISGREYLEEHDRNYIPWYISMISSWLGHSEVATYRLKTSYLGWAV
jgi:hypothetical protein